MKKFLLLFVIHFFLFTFINASTLNMSITSTPGKLNPLISTDTAATEIEQWIFNGLIKYDKNGDITTDLAKNYHFVNNTTLIFNLRKDVKWHDGVPFTADDVIFTYEKILDKKVYTVLKEYFKPVKSVKKLNDYSIEVTYKKPYFQALTIWMQEIIPKHILEKEKEIMTSSFNKHPIGTGPYILKNFKTDSDIVLYANDNYFEGRPKIDKIYYKFIPSSDTSFLFLKQQKLDLGGLTPLQLDRQLDNKFKKDYKIIENPSFSYDYLAFNLRNKKFKNPKIREALSLAIDRKQLIDILFFGHGKIARGPFLAGSYADNKNVKAIAQNLTKAKKLLKELGYDENHPFIFELITSIENKTRVNAAQILQYQLAKAGVKMKIKVMQWQAFLNTVVEPRKFETVLLGWTTPLTSNAYPLWHGSSDKLGGYNFIGYHNKQVDKLIEKGSETIDRKELSKIYQKIFKIIVKENPYLFLYIPNSILAINSKIKNIEPTFVGIIHNQKDWIKTE